MNKIDYVEIGKRIRTARISQGLTQEAASEKCDITSSYYGNLERGNRKMSVETLMKISHGLGISVDSLLFGKDLPQNQQLNNLFERVQEQFDEQQLNKFLTIMSSIADILDKI